MEPEEEETAAAAAVVQVDDADRLLMYKIERPVFNEAHLRSRLLHRKEKTTTLRQKLALHFQ